MIDFSCCEVEKALKELFRENVVQSITPVIKSYNQTFPNDGKTVYYGKFNNPNEAMNLSFRDMAVVNSGTDILFDYVDGFLYDSFTGYEVRLKNQLGTLDNRVVTIYLADTNLNGWPVDVTASNGQVLQVGANVFPYTDVANGLDVTSNVEEVRLSLDMAGTDPSHTKSLNEANIQLNGGTGEYYVELFMHGFM